MKKYLLLAVAAVAVTVGCSKKGMQTEGQIDDTTIEAVKFNIDAPSLVVTKTKGVGSVDEWNNALKLHILGYDRETTDFKKENALIPDVEVDAPVSGTEGLLTVKQTTKDPDNPANEQQESYYYKNSTNYDFYGYFVDDATTGAVEYATRTNGGVYFDVTIDGTQDLMAAKANQAYDVAASGGKVNKNQAYSAYAARRGVHPTLKFKHLLSRFNFYVVAGSSQGEMTRVTGITIDSKTEAKFTVAPDVALAPTGTKTPIAIKNVPYDSKNDSDATDDFAEETPYAGHKDAVSGSYELTDDKIAAILENEYGKVNGCVMVMSGETEHEINIETRLVNSYLPVDSQKHTIEAADIKTADGSTLTKFLPGYQYDVILTIYGPEEIMITAVLSEWKEGGNTLVDPDDIEQPFQITDKYAVIDQTSYDWLPEFYKTQFPWDANEDNLLTGEYGLPWLAVEFTPTDELDVTVTNLDTEFTYSNTYTKVDGNFEGLLTLCAKELGVDSMTGKWLVEVNGYSVIIEVL